MLHQSRTPSLLMPRKKAQSVKAIKKPSGENEGAESLLHARKCMHAS